MTKLRFGLRETPAVAVAQTLAFLVATAFYVYSQYVDFQNVDRQNVRKFYFSTYLLHTCLKGGGVKNKQIVLRTVSVFPNL
jgi:hypothetical protein